MNTFRLFLAAALSSMVVYANESAHNGRDETISLGLSKSVNDEKFQMKPRELSKSADDMNEGWIPELPEDDNQCFGLGLPLVIDKDDNQCFGLPIPIDKSIKKRDYENFSKYKKDDDWQEIKQFYKEIKNQTSYYESPEMSKEFLSENFCDKSCRKGYTCINVYSGKPGGPSRTKCLRPCSKVCSRRWLKCGGFLKDPPRYPILWWNAMNRQCWQVEHRGPVVLEPVPYFMRTTCRCPTRDYTFSDGCDTTGQAASLSNCIEGYLQLGAEINFHDLRDVQFGVVKTTNPTDGDIDFQGHISRSMFCKIDAAEDVEFGGGNSSCNADLRNNVFFDVEMVEDVQFEEGTTLENNIFFNVKANDDFKFQKDDDGAFPTTIKNNNFREVVVADKCSIASGFSVLGLLDIENNSCNNFVENGDNFCTTNAHISGGFTCL